MITIYHLFYFFIRLISAAHMCFIIIVLPISTKILCFDILEQRMVSSLFGAETQVASLALVKVIVSYPFFTSLMPPRDENGSDTNGYH